MLDRAHSSASLFTRSLSSTPFLGAALTLALLTAACTKSEGTSSASASTASTASAAPTASTAAMTAAPDASPNAADTTTGNVPTGGADATAPATSAMAGGSASAGGATAPAASGSAGAAAACGTKPLPDCPLQGWMKANTNPAVSAQDFPALATALDKIATFAPAGYTNWASISKDGAKAARAQDMTAAKASCRTCHDQYKDKYKKELRARKI